MDEPITPSLDVNSAAPSELTGIPGVGPATAKKIIAARPFSSLAELARVKGIAPELAARIAPHFKEVVTPREAAEENLFKPNGHNDAAGDEAGESALTAALEPKLEELKETLRDKAQDVQEFLSAQPEKVEAFFAAQPERLEKVKARTGMSDANLLTLLAACAATLVLSLIFTLALFGLINGGLRYPAQSEFAALSRQMEAATARLDNLEKDSEGIRSRLDALESLSGRMKLIEEENASIRKQLEDNSRQVNDVRAQMEQAQARMDELQKSTDFFNRILAGLRTLLNETPAP